MSLSPAEVQKLIPEIAALARLAPSEAQLEPLARDLAAILTLVDQLEAVDTRGIEPMAHPLGMTQRLRPDVVTEAVDRDALMASAPAARDGLFLVPKVVE
ncbi:MAG: Asp-tRNA(Asn)/Glu-tRNA(Gln) amidotransferase subunit GatC [Candidatus Competibacterales bacterium]